MKNSFSLLSLIYSSQKKLKARYFTEKQCFNFKYKKALNSLLKENWKFKINYSFFKYRLYDILCDYLYFEDQVNDQEKKKFLKYLKRKGFYRELEIARERNVQKDFDYFL